jgi:tripartite-type tricarboxylate transporter receptor subunit TctC
MNMTRRRFNLGALAGAGSLALGGVKFANAAEAWPPSSPIDVIVPFPAGGTTDILGRYVAEAVTKRIPDAKAIVQNVPGATGIIGCGQVARSKPDGSMLLMASIGTVVTNQFTYPNLPYKQSDLMPVINLAEIPNCLMVRPDLGVKTVQEFADLLRKNPDKYKFGSPGFGASGHISGVLFCQQANVKAVHVPYKGAAPMITDLVGGHIDFVVDQLSGAVELIKAGKIQALAVTSKTRSPVLPNLPTLIESGYPNYVMAPWYCVEARAGTPRPIIDKVNAALNQMLKDPVIIQKFHEQAMTPIGGAPEDLRMVEVRDYAVIKEMSKTINFHGTGV